MKRTKHGDVKTHTMNPKIDTGTIKKALISQNTVICNCYTFKQNNASHCIVPQIHLNFRQLPAMWKSVLLAYGAYLTNTTSKEKAD